MSEKAMGVNCGFVVWVTSAVNWHDQVRRMLEERMVKRVDQNTVLVREVEGVVHLSSRKNYEEHRKSRSRQISKAFLS